MSRWMDNAIAEGEGREKEVLVDLGYVNHPITRINADKLKAEGIGRRNFELAGFGRLLVRIPPRKVAAIIAKYPIRLVKEVGGYAWCTHSWFEGENNDLSYAAHGR